MSREIDNPYRIFDFAAGDWVFQEDIINRIKEIFEIRAENKVVVIRGKAGAGKTITLRSIEKHPEKLGKNYIPIYLDSRNLVGLDYEELLHSLYNVIVEKLNEKGYAVKKPAYTRKQEVTGNTLKASLLSVDSVLKPDDILLLILDELDYLLESLEPTIIAAFTQYFRKLEKTWNNYALILAGDKRLSNLIGGEAFNRFLEKADKINIEEYHEEKTIKRLITGPVKHRLTYDEKAIERIIYYSGKNLFFQQLICRFIVEYLHEKKKDRCSWEDVEQVIPGILEETKKKEEFIYTWDRKLSREGRLIASALADERVTEKKDSYYYLKENNLLDAVFGKGLDREINKLQECGYVNKSRGRRFSQCPFKIPLYGEWIKNEHPFIRTVIEHIEIIAHKIELNSLIEEIEKTPADKLIPFNKKEILAIAKKWKALSARGKEKRTADNKNQVKDFLIHFAQRLNLNIKEETQPNPTHAVLDLKNLNFGTLEEALCLVQDRPELIQEDINNIGNIAAVHAEEEVQGKLTLFFYFQRSDKVEELARKEFLNLVAIDENDLKKIMLSDRPLEVFKKVILSRLSLSLVSPYKTEGPAKSTFYGRANLIRRLTGTTDRSFAIVGARKIGKSSLLYKLKEKPPQNTIYIFMDLELEFSHVKNYNAFLRGLQAEIKEVPGIKVDFGIFPFGRALSRLPKIIKELAKDGKRVVFILDEVDYLIKFDKKHGYKLTHIFRTLSQKPHCQFIFAGFKVLYHGKREIEEPLYNFCEEIILEPLDQKSALDLITIPMRNIGIQYKNPGDRELILEYTARHPTLLQFFCKNLVERVEKHEKVEDRRTIFKEDIEALFASKYERYVIDDVYMFSSELTPLNRLVLVLMVEEHPLKKSFTTDETRDRLIRAGIKISRNEVHKSLKILEMRFILKDEGRDKYRFALPIFPEILKKRIDRNFKERTIKEIMENGTESL
jgi:hypothetical protein